MNAIINLLKSKDINNFQLGLILAYKKGIINIIKEHDYVDVNGTVRKHYLLKIDNITINLHTFTYDNYYVYMPLLHNLIFFVPNNHPNHVFNDKVIIKNEEIYNIFKVLTENAK